MNRATGVVGATGAPNFIPPDLPPGAEVVPGLGIVHWPSEQERQDYAGLIRTRHRPHRWHDTALHLTPPFVTHDSYCLACGPGQQWSSCPQAIWAAHVPPVTQAVAA